MAIVTDDIELLQEFTKDKNPAQRKTGAIKKEGLRRKFGASKQYSALLATLNEMFDEEDVRPIVIFQTDGDQYRLIPSKNTPPGKISPASTYAQKLYNSFTFEDLRSVIEKSRATVYNVIPGVASGRTFAGRTVGKKPDRRLKFS